MLDDTDFELINSTYSHLEKNDSEDRGIHYLEFIALLTKQHNYTPGQGEAQSGDLDKIVRKKLLDNATTMKEVFKRVDRDKSGTVDKDEMKAVLKLYNIDCSDEAFDTLFSEYDRNGDGRFSYGEFVQLLQDSK